ncbi:JAB domain-containing protein [Paraburkholderia sp. Cy-641]|uniref:RadC family protein n=1 Tax=Paraburkholderia sp. Cy-641 TaxID=2608337 RepID=UPI00141FE1F5|nr:DNA repair protein RadC [Paraburkholderia sp. Cy-641]NIF76187.1 JAB domain-containing protein [Paraburkholderia sp. Cy-641]
MTDFASTIDETPEATALPAPRTRAAAAPGGATPRKRARSRLLRGKWHKHDMPRERLIKQGATVLSDTEMIALVLGSGLPGHDVFSVASQLLGRFGSLRAMLDATYTDFDGIRGIGPAKKAQLLAIMEMARRSLVDKMRKRELMNSPETVENYLRLLIGGRPQEVFVSLFLDARHRLIDCEESAHGSLTRMAVYPREIVRRALNANAASLIVAHNHPSGAVQPSASDCRLTHTLRDALALIDVQLVDHLVIGADSVYSFARAGWPGAPTHGAVSGIANKV